MVGIAGAPGAGSDKCNGGGAGRRPSGRSAVTVAYVPGPRNAFPFLPPWAYHARAADDGDCPGMWGATMRNLKRAVVVRRASATRRKQRRRAGAATALRRRRQRQRFSSTTTTHSVRERLKIKLYARRPFNQPQQQVLITGELGLETAANVPGYLDKAAEFIDSRSKRLIFNITQCSRLWPSAITLLCSLKEWVEMTAVRDRRPVLGSTYASSSEVNEYLSACGFHEYVRAPVNTAAQIDKSGIVKIRRETNRNDINLREDEVMALVRRHTAFNEEQLEWFNSVVLTEIFANVVEHGGPRRGRGWWLLAQYHERHQFISLCIADNGIGIRNSLMSGPQSGDLETRLYDDPSNDGAFIKLAMEENISGSIRASVRTKGLRKRYKRGARRGNGLKRVRATCQQLGIGWHLLSHFGCVAIDPLGAITGVHNRSSRVFAGTLYHLIIPAR
jgi:anti-sigma regulatory factor (Ser/Thr protein kinase)